MKMGWMSLNCVLETHSFYLKHLDEEKMKKKIHKKIEKFKKNEQEYLLH
jgi:hypothetical protein